jgi:hypothetical protein
MVDLGLNVTACQRAIKTVEKRLISVVSVSSKKDVIYLRSCQT